jgi:hypothetical protein
MSVSSGQKQLNKLERLLTPKEWAIGLIEEMRAHLSETDFEKAVTGREYRECPWIKPFLKLSQQAEARHPGEHPEDIDQRYRYSLKLRTEFRALWIFIGTTNHIIRDGAHVTGLTTALAAGELETLALKDTFSRTAKAAAACIEENEGNGKTKTVLEILRAYADPSLPSEIELLANGLTNLMKVIFGYETTIKVAQDLYFDGHPFLFRDVEDSLMQTVTAVTSAALTLNAYLRARSKLLESGISDEDERKVAALRERIGHFVIDIDMIRNGASLVNPEKWMKYSKEIATADSLLESRGDEMYRWRVHREMVEAAG